MAVLCALHVVRRLYAKATRKPVRGEVVLITGGASGIGRQMARRFSRLGATLVLWDMNSEALAKVSKEITNETGGDVHTYTVDITDREKVYDLAEQVISRVGRVDILVNNAGIVAGKSILNPQYDDRLAEKTIAVNTTAHLWTIRAFVPDMVRRNHGHVVTIASAAGLVGTCGLAEYCASKFGAVGLNEALRREFKRYGHSGCRTTVVCPFYINTGMFKGVRSRLIPILDEQYVADSIVNAVRENEEFLGLPSLVHYGSMLLNAILPVPILDFCYKLSGMSSTMDQFVGRAQ
uniref:Short-chain dehydrogenase/reductase 3 n=1 Tax=Arcella intermedia TaxID=1963864 RepID=A0A6B2LBN0_9EUKA